MLDSLLRDLKALWLQRRREVDARYRRSLPLADYVVDRWEKARELGFGEGTSVYDSVLVLGDVRVGNNTWIGPFVVLDGSGGLTIGSHCSISAGTQLYSHDTVEWAVSAGKTAPTRAPTRVGDNCYIGPNTVVAKGVSIGDGCVIGANSLVLHDIAPGSKAYGTPCRIVGPAPTPACL
jgi:acetyltransferase-like isoleucine patch superfamily enzyme